MTTFSCRRTGPIPVLVACAIGLVCLPVDQFAQVASDNGRAPSPFSRTEVHGLVSASYSHNFNNPPSRTNGLRVFDIDDNQFVPDVAELVLLQNAVNTGDAGFRLDVTVGASIPAATASRGLFRDATGVGEDIDLQQAYITYIVPVGDGLRVDLGKFVTWAGYEVIDGYDGFNDNGTRSFLFGYAIPFTHTGLRLAYSAGQDITASIMAVNGWDVVADNNDAPTLGGQLLFRLGENSSTALTYIGGAERDGNSSDVRHVVDAVATIKVSDGLTLGANVDYGLEADGAGPGADALWQGAAGYLKFAFSDDFSISLRGEIFDDRDGVRTGIPQTLKEVTVTPTLNAGNGCVFRADLRIDFSNVPSFEQHDGSTARNQPTLQFNGLFAF